MAVKATITTSNGDTLTTKTMNGNNFVFSSEQDTSIFDGDVTSTLVISGTDGMDGTYENMIFTQQMKLGDNYLICFHEEDPETTREKEIAALNTLVETVSKVSGENADAITDVQLALAELCDLILSDEEE